MGIRAMVTKLVHPSAEADSCSPAGPFGEHHSDRARAIAARARAGGYPPRYIVAGWQPVGARSRWSGWSRASRPVTPARPPVRRRVPPAA